MFNKYGAASEKLSDFAFHISDEVKEFLKDNSEDNPVMMRALSDYVIMAIGATTAETILFRAMKMRKEEKKVN